MAFVPVSDDEIKSLDSCKTLKEFVANYFKTFPDKVAADPSHFVNRASGIWYNREKHVKELMEKERSNKTQIKSIVSTDPKSTGISIGSQPQSLSRVDILQKIYDQSVLQTKAMQELLDMFKKM